MKKDNIPSAITRKQFLKLTSAGVFAYIGFVPPYWHQHTKNVNEQTAIELTPQQVISQFIGGRASEITFKKIPDDPEHPGKMVFVIEAKDGNVAVSGNSAVAQLRGAYTYLKETCNSMITWGGQHVDIPNIWPDYSKRVVAPYKYTLQDNVCVFGYTTPYFKWPQWQRYLDVMALHGYNMMYAPVGMEAIWRRVWMHMGFSNQELADFFTGPAYLPWHRMGNINKYSGPLPDDFFPQSINLQKKILEKMRTLGITPVAPAFAGFVPKKFKMKFPDAKVRDSDNWGGFKDSYATHILDPLSPYFSKIGKAFIKEWEKEFGKATFFFADPFNEMNPPLSSDHSEDAKQQDLARYGKAIYASIDQVEPGATWVKMGWVFVDEQFWTKDRAEAFLRDVPNDKMIIVDLNAESRPQWSRLDNFFGKQWIYSIIPNWGGTSQLGGTLAQYGKIIPEMKQQKNTKHLIGFGNSPEGTENNEAIYEIASDAAWLNKEIKLNQWITQYCEDRYGKVNQELIIAWQFLARGRYGKRVGHPVNKFQSSPDGSSIYYTKYDLGRDVYLDKALGIFLGQAEQFKNNELFVNDLIEIATYHFSALADEHVIELKKRVSQLDFKEANAEMQMVKKIVSNIDLILSGHTIYNIDRWVNLARAWGQNKGQKDYYEADAKRIITYWGGSLSEYSARLWSGLVKNYYLARWEAWFNAKKEGKQFNTKAWEQHWVETPGNYHSRKVEDANDVISLIRNMRKENK